MALLDIALCTEKLVQNVLTFIIPYLKQHPELLEEDNVIETLMQRFREDEEVSEGVKKVVKTAKKKSTTGKKPKIVVASDSEEEEDKPPPRKPVIKKNGAKKVDSESESEEVAKLVPKSNVKKVEDKKKSSVKKVESEDEDSGEKVERIKLKKPERAKGMKPFIPKKKGEETKPEGVEKKDEEEKEKEKTEEGEDEEEKGEEDVEKGEESGEKEKGEGREDEKEESEEDVEKGDEDEEEAEKEESEEKKEEKPKKKLKFNQTITVTMGCAAENRAGMQIIGKTAEKEDGFNLEDLERAKAWFERKGIVCELVCLNDFLPKGKEKELKLKADKAYILIARKGLAAICDPDAFYVEQTSLKPDKKAWMKGKVCNLHARYNLCFNHTKQSPDYENKKGTIIAYKDVPLLDKVRRSMSEIIGSKGKHLVAEGNYYPDPQGESYISKHGDGERRKVIATRVGMNMKFHYQWYYKFEAISELITFNLEHGTIYFMSLKAVGSDWKRPSIITLRHAAGEENMIDAKKKKSMKK